ncbi:pyrroloquinoline-quinone synthase PqqC [Bradyrhizobium japonicum]
MTALSIGKDIRLNSSEELEATLRHIGATRYHSLHPFHKLLHGGKLNKGQVQAWALNRYYYQSTIPIKDAVVISRFRDRATRLEWRHRIEDHDGDIGSEGGIERWLKLTEGLGLDTAYVESTEGILPATRFAVEAYVHYCREKSPLEAIASSLTELFAPNLHEERISGMLEHYDFVNPDIMSYFKRRLAQAPRDAGFALDYVKAHATTPEQRASVCNALIFKTNVLWVQLDALQHAYVEGHIPPARSCPKRAEDQSNGRAAEHQRQRGKPPGAAAACQAEI